MTSAPDLAEPVLGFRAWHVDDEGWLRPWSFPGEPWQPGPNHARCQTYPSHAPPVGDCMCGLYALADLRDARLDGGGDQAVGAIAAWGDMEVHRTGFRAETACVIALAEPPGISPSRRERLEQAAVRYDVALVPRAELAVLASLYASPAPALDNLRPRRPDGPAGPWLDDRFAGVERGIAAAEHLWGQTRVGEVTLGITAALAGRVGRLDGSFPLPPAGRRVEAGEVLTVLGTDAGESFYLWAPVSGTVAAVNERLTARPELVLEEPTGEGWLLSLVPSRWAEQSRAFLWGTAAKRYAVALADPDAFSDLQVERLRAIPPVRSWRDIRELIARERDAPFFSDAEDLYERLGAPLAACLRDDGLLRDAVRRFGVDVVFRVAQPDAVLRVTGSREQPAIVCGPAASGPADLELEMDADVALAFFTDTLDPTVELRTGAMRTALPRQRALILLSSLRRLRVGRIPRIPTWERRSPFGSSLL